MVPLDRWYSGSSATIRAPRTAPGRFRSCLRPMVTIRPALCAQHAFGASRTLHYVITLPSPRPRSRAALGASTGTKTRCLRPYRPSPIIFRPAMGFVRWEQLSRSQILPLLSTHQKHCFWWSWSWVVGGFGGLWGCLWSTQQPGDLGAMSGRINTPHCRTTHAIFPL